MGQTQGIPTQIPDTDILYIIIQYYRFFLLLLLKLVQLLATGSFSQGVLYPLNTLPLPPSFLPSNTTRCSRLILGFLFLALEYTTSQGILTLFFIGERGLEVMICVLCVLTSGVSLFSSPQTQGMYIRIFQPMYTYTFIISVSICVCVAGVRVWFIQPWLCCFFCKFTVWQKLLSLQYICLFG